ncbi:uncharacterized [Tachysurus ichikawai]
MILCDASVLEMLPMASAVSFASCCTSFDKLLTWSRAGVANPRLPSRMRLFARFLAALMFSSFRIAWVLEKSLWAQNNQNVYKRIAFTMGPPTCLSLSWVCLRPIINADGQLVLGLQVQLVLQLLRDALHIGLLEGLVIPA